MDQFHPAQLQLVVTHLDHTPDTRLNPPHPPTANFTKKRLIKKSIILGSISLREEGTSSSKNPIQYSVALDPSRGQCSIEGVCAKIKEQVGFDVILLDSKCYPLLKK